MAVGSSLREMQEYKSVQCRGLLDVSGGSANDNCCIRRVDVGTWCILGQVDATGAAVEYVGVEEGNWSRGGRGSRGGDRGVCRFGKIIGVNKFINFTNYMSDPTPSGIPSDMVLASAMVLGRVDSFL